MSSRLYDTLLDLEALLILILSFYFLVIYLRDNQTKFLITKLDMSYSRSEQLKKFGLTFTFGVVMGVLALYNSWWAHHPLLCFALIFSCGTIFIHESFVLAFFILILFLRPWELLEAKYMSQAQVWTVFNIKDLVSLPKLWFLLMFGNYIASWSSRKKIKWNILDLGVLIFILWMLVPILVKSNVEDFKYFFETLFSSGLIYFLIRAYLNDEFCYQMIVKTLAFVGLFLLLTTFIQFTATYGLDNKSERLEIFGKFGNANDLAALIVLCCPFIFMMSKSKIIKSLMGAIVLVAIYITQSRGGFYGIIIVFLTYLTSIQQFKKLSLKKIIAGVVSLALVFVLYSSLLGRGESEMNVSSLARINCWVAAVRMAIYNPISGVGFHNYPINFERYTLQFLEFGDRTAHSSFFLVLGEGGAIGLLIYLFLFKNGLQYVFKLRKVRPEVFASLLGYMVTMIFLSHSYLSSVYILLAVISSLYMLNEQDLKTVLASHSEN